MTALEKDTTAIVYLERLPVESLLNSLKVVPSVSENTFQMLLELCVTLNASKWFFFSGGTHLFQMRGGLWCMFNGPKFSSVFHFMYHNVNISWRLRCLNLSVFTVVNRKST